MHRMKLYNKQSKCANVDPIEIYAETTAPLLDEEETAAGKGSETIGKYGLVNPNDSMIKGKSSMKYAIAESKE